MTVLVGGVSMQTNNAAGLFRLVTEGYVQGIYEPDPGLRYQVAQGLVASTETLPMFGGVAIKANIPVAGPGGVLGGTLARATTAAGINAFCVSNHMYNSIITPSISAPSVGTNMSAQYAALGSGLRLAVAIAPSLATTLTSGTASISTQVSWDFLNQQLVPYTPVYSNVTITGAVWANTAGGRTTFTVGTDLTTTLAAGSVIDVTGVVNTGGTSTSAFNGTFVVVSVTSTTVVVTQTASVSPGTYASGGTVLAGGGALAVQVLAANIGNSYTISLDSNGNAQWNTTGSAAIIRL